MNQLTIGGIITNAFAIGMKNLGSILGAIILWLLTLWIPYVNVGTTIGIIGMVVSMSKGHIFSPVEIFDRKYRQYMGEFFLLTAFLLFGVLIGYSFVILPGVVITIAWGQAIYLLLDKGLNPAECLTVSNRITYGKKWTIFGGIFVLSVLLSLAILILVYLFRQISEDFSILVAVVAYLFFISIRFGASAYIYQVLSQGLEGGDDAPASVE